MRYLKKINLFVLIIHMSAFCNAPLPMQTKIATAPNFNYSNLRLY